MNENVSVISECDNLEIENYLKSCGSYPKRTEMKFVESVCSSFGGHQSSSGDVGGLIQYSKCMLNKFRNELRESADSLDIDKHIIIEKVRLNELLKSRIKEYLRNHPCHVEPPIEQIQPVKIVHFKEKPKPLVRNGRRVKSIDRHVNCIGNKKPAKPVFISRKSQEINENKIKSLRFGRNIIIDPKPVTSYYPRRIFNDTVPEAQEFHRATWHDRLMGLDSASSSNCTIVQTTTTTNRVIEKSEIKILRYNYDWGGTDVAPNESNTGGNEKTQNIDQTTQTETNIVTTKSVQCFIEELHEIDIQPEIIKQLPENLPVCESSVVQVSSHETDENMQVTLGSSFVYEYESTFDESSSDETELSETVRPAGKSKQLVPITNVPPPRQPNILLESVVYEDKKLDHRDAQIQTEFEPIHKVISPKNIQISCGRGVHDEDSPNEIELELSRLDEEIMHDKFKLLSVLRQSPRDCNISQLSEIQLQLTPFKSRPAVEFIPSPLELSSIRPISLSHTTKTFDLSDEKCWKTINKIQMDATQHPFSPKTETDEVAKRAAEKFLKSTALNSNDQVAKPDQHNSTISTCGSNVVMVTSSSEYESDSTVTSHRYVFTRYTKSGKISEGEVLSLGEVRKFTDDSE